MARTLNESLDTDMSTTTSPRELVLVGGGHTHALVLAEWAKTPPANDDIRLTLINPGPTAAYSGMLPGFVAGHYRRDELEIDLAHLSRTAGVRMILGAATEIDRTRKEIHVTGHAPLRYDVASIDIGITSAMPSLDGFAQHAVPAKPLDGFAQAWSVFTPASQPNRSSGYIQLSSAAASRAPNWPWPWHMPCAASRAQGSH